MATPVMALMVNSTVLLAHVLMSMSKNKHKQTTNQQKTAKRKAVLHLQVLPRSNEQTEKQASGDAEVQPKTDRPIWFSLSNLSLFT